MKFLTYLQEEYCDVIKYMGTAHPVFENPTADDLKELIGHDLRFTAVNSTKKLYIWRASISNHDSTVRYLINRKTIPPIEDSVSTDSNLFNGFAKIEGKKLSMGESDDFTFYDLDVLRERLQKNWDWLKPYFTNLNYIHDLQTKLNKKLMTWK
jgi:hypothetical protein